MLALASACARTSEPSADEVAVASAERSHDLARGIGANDLEVVAVSQGDLALAGANPGEGWFTAIYRREGGAWRRLADKGNAPAACLFTVAGVDGATARSLSDALFTRAHTMKPDVETVSCRPGSS